MKKIILLIALFWIITDLTPHDTLSAEKKTLRIISLAPSTTEILFSLGLAEEVVGVSTFCNYPPEAQKKEKVGTFSQPDVEKIFSLRPDIIFATGLEQATPVGKLRKLGFNVYICDPSNMEELFESIAQIAKLSGKEKEAALLIAQMRSKIKDIKKRIAGISYDERPRVFVEIWHDPLMTAGKGSFLDELIDLAGGINIAHDAPRPFSRFSPEQVIKRNPDCIILGYMSNKYDFKRRVGWGKINAVKNSRIYDDISSDIFLRPGPRLTEGLEQIHKRLYPE